MPALFVLSFDGSGGQLGVSVWPDSSLTVLLSRLGAYRRGKVLFSWWFRENEFKHGV